MIHNLTPLGLTSNQWSHKTAQAADSWLGNASKKSCFPITHFSRKKIKMRFSEKELFRFSKKFENTLLRKEEPVNS